MARTDFNHTGTSQASGSHIKPEWIAFLYVGIIFLILFSAFYILKKVCDTCGWLQAGFANARVCTEGGGRHRQIKDAQSPYRAGAPPTVYGHTGEITFCESHKKQHLYNLRFILKSSVEMLGRGSLGSTYKVILRNGSAVAVKRLKEMDLKQKEFEQHVSKLGQLSMHNMIPVQSYYYSKGLVFLIYDYACLGSLSSLIQGARRCKHTPLDWSTRIRIVTDVARAIQSLHQNSVVHGNIKSSNIFLNTDFTAMVSECSLVQMCPKALAEEATLGYKAPELIDASTPNFMSDVYSFGVLFMELLTGISPQSFPSYQVASSETRDGNNEGVNLDASDLPNWVAQSSETCIDPQLSPDRFESTIAQMLHVATACVSSLAESRPSMSKVIDMMEHIRLIQETDSDPLNEKMVFSDFESSPEFDMSTFV